MKTLNSIAVEYLLRNNSQQNQNISEEQTKEVVELNLEQYVNQKSLLFQMYDLEEYEDFFLSN